MIAWPSRLKCHIIEKVMNDRFRRNVSLVFLGLALFVINATAYFASVRAQKVVGFAAARPEAVTAAVFVVATLLTAVMVWLLRNLIRSGGRFWLAVLAGTALSLAALSVFSPLTGVPDNYWNVLMSRGWAVHGRNPYTTTATELSSDPLFARTAVEWRGDAMLYGPVWSLAAVLPVAFFRDPEAELLAMRIMLAGLYAAGGLLLWVSLRRRRSVADNSSASPSSGAEADLFLTVWLLNPAGWFEVANAGHNEGLLVLFLAVFAIGLRRADPRLALPALSAAVMTKYWPAVLIPVLFGLRGAKKSHWLLGLVGAAAVTSTIFLFGGPAIMLPALVKHQNLVSPGYFSPLFFLFWQILIAAGKQTLDAFAAAQTVTAAIFLIAAATITIFLIRRRMAPDQAAAWIIAALFITAMSWLQPWYLLTLMPFVIRPDASRWGERSLVAVFFLAVLAFLSYGVAWAWIAVGLAITLLIMVFARPQLLRRG
jgi:alpha-1,6-mannosyltransferase